jgi:hypothetical protein
VARIDLSSDHLTVRFTLKERLLGLVRDFSAPRPAIESATLVESWHEVRGLRVGLGMPGYRLLGTWRSRGHKQLVALRRGEPAVRIALRGTTYAEVVVSTPDAERLVAELNG